ncbi:MarR family winged helix-turn-helix transcriptional regulator [Nocardioides marinquilinus]|uniref:MarR family winged helix-turn-helix transcriptional regulator n=1 Tax=Nocardioides marinquilinus TaxID=1210400 RepID=UPI0031EE2D90
MPETLVAVRELVTASTHLSHAIGRRAGLNRTELAALEHLVETPAAPGELAGLLEVSTAASTGVVDRLERRAHVERRPHPTDRRRLEVHVTDSGRAEMLGYLRPMLDALSAIDADLTDDERAVVVRFLRAAAAAVRRAADEPPAQ